MDKRIWTYWHQGFDQAPEVVRLALESWRRLNAGWEVLALDRVTIRDHVDLAREIDVARTDLTVQKISALGRLCLLTRFGGVWTDATVFCARPLDDWLSPCMATGFFAFHNPGPDRLASNWMIAAEATNPLLLELHRRFLGLWKQNRFSNQDTPLGAYLLRRLLPVFNTDTRRTRFWLGFVATKILRVYPYFVFHYVFNQIIEDDAECRRIWNDAMPLDAMPPHVLQDLGFTNDAEAALTAIRNAASPVYKLNWRVDASSPYWAAVLTRLRLLLGPEDGMNTTTPLDPRAGAMPS